MVLAFVVLAFFVLAFLTPTVLSQAGIIGFVDGKFLRHCASDDPNVDRADYVTPPAARSAHETPRGGWELKIATAARSRRGSRWCTVT